MSPRTIRTFAHSLTLVPVALFFNIGSAAAAGSVDDLLEQQRAYLAGRATTMSAPTSTQRSTSEAGSHGDAQEHARRLLLDVPTRTSSTHRPDVSGANGNRVYGDAQMLARHVLLGRGDAPSPGS